jgi:hypothetical protein
MVTIISISISAILGVFGNMKIGGIFLAIGIFSFIVVEVAFSTKNMKKIHSLKG